MSSDYALRAEGLGKRYHLYARPVDRLKQMLWRGRRMYFQEYSALEDVSFTLGHGEVMGIVGMNGAGKSTLLKIICGVLQPSAGKLDVQGRIAALLELGAGFNPEFSGRENIHMNASLLGLSPQEIARRIEGIIDFSGIREFIDQPVKTYSSGMYVRLAFSIATSVDPDILVIDEALSVGDGAFARKSFDRIMALRDAGKTILFCSHSMYQIEALCQRALWLEKGRIRMLGDAVQVTSAYNAALALESGKPGSIGSPSEAAGLPEWKPADDRPIPAAVPGSGRILRVNGECDGVRGKRLVVHSLVSTLTVDVEFVLDPALPPPNVALTIESASGMQVSSVISKGHPAAVRMNAAGHGLATVSFPNIPLLKGEYRITAYLACERGIHPYDIAPQCLILDVTQDRDNLLQGVVILPNIWPEPVKSPNV